MLCATLCAMMPRPARPHMGLVLVWVADGKMLSEAAAVAAIFACGACTLCAWCVSFCQIGDGRRGWGVGMALRAIVWFVGGDPGACFIESSLRWHTNCVFVLKGLRSNFAHTPPSELCAVGACALFG